MHGKEKPLEDFGLWLDSLPFKHKIVIAGNHDVSLQDNWYSHHYWRYHKKQLDSQRIKKNLMSHCTYLEDNEVTVNGIRIYGTPWFPAYQDWAFGLFSDQLKFAWSLIPTGIDILVTHVPPQGTKSKLSNGDDIGCAQLVEAIKRIKPIANVCGHIHDSYGIIKPCSGTPLFANAAIVNSHYVAVNSPIVFDVI